MHPKLYFSDVSALQAKVSSEPDLWNRIYNEYRTYTLTYSHPDDEPGEDNWVTSWCIRWPAFVYAVTKDATSGATAKKNLLKVCSWSTWTRAWFTNNGYKMGYTTGQIAIAVGEAYDWIHELLTDAEKSTVRAAVVAKGLTPAVAEIAHGCGGMYPCDANTNRIPHGFGGVAVAGLALLIDDPTNQTYLTPLEKIFTVMEDKFFEAFDDNGGWHEGVTYSGFGLSAGPGAAYYAVALKNVLGRTVPGKFYKAMNLPLYFLPIDRLAATDTFGDCNFKDGFPTGGACMLIAATKNPYYQWYYKNSKRYFWDTLFEFIFKDNTIPTKDPSIDLARDAHFPAIGGIVSRTGWGTSDIMFAMRAGGYAYDHYRPEQNSIVLDAFGERFLTAPGAAGAGSSDYHSRQTLSQNTVLVNQDSYSQYKREQQPKGSVLGSIRDFVSAPNYFHVVGDAVKAYKGALARYDRRVIFVKPDYLVIMDDVVPTTPGRIDVLFHTTGSISVSGTTITISRPKGTLYIDELSPSALSFSAATGSPCYYGGSDHAVNFMKTYLPSTSRALIMHVLSLVPAGGTKPQVTKTVQTNAITATLTYPNGRVDRVVVRTADGTITSGDIVTDAGAIMLRTVNDAPVTHHMEGGTYLTYKGVAVTPAPPPPPVPEPTPTPPPEPVPEPEPTPEPTPEPEPVPVPTTPPMDMAQAVAYMLIAVSVITLVLVFLQKKEAPGGIP